MALEDASDESGQPTRIGAGSFATVYVLRGGPVAYKVVARSAEGPTLRHEYLILERLYKECGEEQNFSIPRPFAFSDPDPSSTEDGSLSQTHLNPSGSVDYPIVTQALMDIFERATYAMDRVPAIPYDAGRLIASMYFPTGFKNFPPALCRLYFGKTYRTDGPTPRFINTTNFPLDEYRYNKLVEAYPDRLSLDARDIEFVLGGTGGSRFTYFVIDFNQVSTWTKGPDVTPLVKAFFDNDPYYPRPNPEDDLYTSFKSAYYRSCPDSDVGLANAFIEAIETEHGRSRNLQAS
ncbi:hypothetical protein EST38_g6380 [Candolleomyces aberdarensis]|uniref:DUF3669 domain-containing protein n=1 Tax=Candolleomyces aberdarensis TaxID=2316362 RepID=A0A4Q2DKR7_9AGAR|nr:hypothetical protein EST38_g6380 [Candolleomyces aberdarensis]